MATGKTRREVGPAKSGLQVSDPKLLVIKLPRSAKLRVSPEMFWRLCGENRDLRLERTAKGTVIVMAPCGLATGGRNSKLTMRLGNWAEANGTGEAYDSSAGYTLPNGAVLGPDASWVSHARLELISLEERERFPRVCPDFVVELRSPSDRVKTLRRKMVEYLAQGVRLGWLLDPITGLAEVYRPGREAEVLNRPATLSGEDVLPGFVLDLRGILFDQAV